MQLGELQKSYKDIKDTGAELIAISADPVVDAQRAAVEMKLSYPILSDPSKGMITSWGVLHPQEGIARPAMFIVNKQGRIVWKYIGADANDRPAISVVLKQLAAAK